MILHLLIKSKTRLKCYTNVSNDLFLDTLSSYMYKYNAVIFFSYKRLICYPCFLTQVLNLLIWAVAATSACLVLYGLYDSMDGRPLSTGVSALYNATNRTVWGACVCWVIFACATGNGGPVNTLLSWSPFGPLAKLSYCVYLVHPVIMYANYYSQRTSIYLDDFSAVSLS